MPKVRLTKKRRPSNAIETDGTAIAKAQFHISLSTNEMTQIQLDLTSAADNKAFLKALTEQMDNIIQYAQPLDKPALTDLYIVLELDGKKDGERCWRMKISGDGDYKKVDPAVEGAVGPLEALEMLVRNLEKKQQESV
ncbi:uncharacterized protein CC84DRAFT_1220265 [Paraphaeosphaeria sporulosa]|uniref:Uncharacterized protein n=1 Tax=Paraphaeosphaeria sporulosa TaxID=1460663 RepID=A0A177C598_9PLEO|nr:uncharacterized protein CC84DRAFT_1220265 [Paraphaeosphaeria sporulosa]OAG01887.1 hypothetical protein CC84DRAFT_1220265 [Paraphaeosphaeria sporulosa]